MDDDRAAIEWTVEHHDELDSTNEEARRRGSEAPHGLVITAHRQLQGRGRGDHRWESPEGGLYASIVLRDVPAAVAAPLPLIAAKAALDGLQDLGLRANLWLKWPNDLMLGEAAPTHKLGGVLVESSSSGEDRLDRVVIGLGINVATPEEALPVGTDPPASTLAGRFGDEVTDMVHVDPEDVLDEFLDRFDEALTAFDEAPVEALEELVRTCNDRLAYRGQRVRCTTTDGVALEGVVKGIDDHGALLLQGTDGQRPLAPWDVTGLRPSEPKDEPVRD